VNGLDVTRRPRRMFIIDFGTKRTEEDCAKYEAPFAHVCAEVRPERIGNNRALYAKYWWRHVEPRPGMLTALAPLPRFLTTVAVSKHRLFAWMEAPTLPDHAVFAFARDDDYFFGVLHSRIHEVWALKLGTRLETRPRYTPTTCFETFPLPFADDVSQLDKAASPWDRTIETRFLTVREEPPPSSPREHREAIAAAAKELNTLRENWLNPPEWTQTRTLEFPGSQDGPWARFIESGTHEDAAASQSKIKTQNSKIGLVRYPLTEPRDAGCAAKLAKRTLTNLYNESPAWLANAHARLDAAVAAAYGWNDLATGVSDPGHSADDEILARLLALNHARAAAEKASEAKPAKKARASREKTDDELL
jgi:hypothetical protein